MIYFNVNAINKDNGESEFIRIKTNGLMFWTEDESGAFINPAFNSRKSFLIFKDVLEYTNILDFPKSIMEAESNNYKLLVTTNDL